MLGVTVLVCLWAASPLLAMEVLCEWKTLDLPFPDEEARIAYNAINGSKAFLIDVDKSSWDPKDRMFVTIPRWFEAYPFTVGTAEVTSDGCKLAPYPNWEMNKLGSCDAITFVLRVKCDECGRLWMLDSGVVENLAPNSRQDLCPMQLLVFDVKTDELLWRYRVPADSRVNTTVITNLNVDNQEGCDHPFVYLADFTGYGLIVVEVTASGDKWSGDSWRFGGDYFSFCPTATHFDIDGVEFDVADGVVSLALSPPVSSYWKCHSRVLFFHSLSSCREYAVCTRDIKTRNGSLSVARAPIPLDGQSCPADMSGPILFFGSLPDNSLSCWNMNLEYSRENIVKVYKNDETYQFASGLKVIHHKCEDWIFALTSKFQNVATGKMNYSNVNFRIMAAPVSSLVCGTKCDPHHRHHHNYSVT